MTAEIAYIALGYKIYSEFGWQVFKLLGADRQIKRIYMQYQILQCLMRFDIFFWLGFSVQVWRQLRQSPSMTVVTDIRCQTAHCAGP